MSLENELAYERDIRELREENARLRANTCDTKAFRDEEDRADRMTRELAEARVLAEARAESLEACMESDAKHRAEVERLRIGNAALSANVSIEKAAAEKAEAEAEQLREAVKRLLRFEASFGEQDIPEEDRAFARAALRGGEK